MNKKTKTSGSLVYCGPNIKGLAMTWTVYEHLTKPKSDQSGCKG